MNVAYYIPLAGCLCNVFFALFVFFQAPRAVANRVYLLLGLAIATWNLASYELFVVTTHGEARSLGAGPRFVGVIFVTVAAFVHLSLVIAGYLRSAGSAALYAFSTACSVVLDCTPWFIRDVQSISAPPAGMQRRARPFIC